MNRYHTFGQRLIAAIIDGIVFVPIAFFGEMLFNPHGGNSIIWNIILSALSVTYTVYLHGKYGQTIGKMVTKIKVVKHSDESQIIGFEKALLRESVWVGLLVLDIIYALFFNDATEYESTSSLISFGWLLAELISMLFNEKRRAVHDLIAGSVVIDITVYSEWEKKFLPKV